MVIWISWNIDIWRSLNSRDSFPRRKFKNQALTSCSTGSILSPSTISCELQAKTAEIDLEKCNFRNFRRSVTLTLVCICGRGLAIHHSRLKSEKLFEDVRMDGQTDTPEFQSTRSSPVDDLKTESEVWLPYNIQLTNATCIFLWLEPGGPYRQDSWNQRPYTLCPQKTGPPKHV